jgi:histidine ammonia-lyase
MPHIAQRVRTITNNIKYILGMEMMHAAQAVSLRKQAAPGLPLGKGTTAAYEEFRRTIPWLDRDRTLSTDIEKAYGVVNEGGMLRTALSASARA